MALKFDKETRTVEGYVAVWNTPSTTIPGIGKEYVERGAFNDAIKKNNIRLLNSHNKHEVLASTKAGTLNVVEDDVGLKIKAKLPQVTYADNLFTLVDNKEEFGGSFGGNAKAKHIEGGQALTYCDLQEVTITALPQYQSTLTRSVSEYSLTIENQIKEQEMETKKEDTTAAVEAGISTVNELRAINKKLIEINEVKRDMETKVTPAIDPTRIGMDAKEKQQYSICNLIRSFKNGKLNSCYEMDVSQQIARSIGSDPKGTVYVPMGELNYVERAAYNSTTLAALQTTQWTDFVSVLKNKLVFGQAGGRIINGLVGTVKIPKQSSSASITWVSSEGGDVSETEWTSTASISFSPKTFGCWSKIERSQYVQTSYNVEQLVRDDLLSSVAVAMDSAAFVGTGLSGQPTGLFNNSSVGRMSSADGFTGTLSRTNIIKSIGYVEDANYDGTLAFVCTPLVKAKLRVTPEVTGFPTWLWQDGKVCDLPAYASNILKASNVDEYATQKHFAIVGDFSQSIIGTWSALDIKLDDITYANSGAIKVIALGDMDHQVRIPEAFYTFDDINIT